MRGRPVLLTASCPQGSHPRRQLVRLHRRRRRGRRLDDPEVWRKANPSFGLSVKAEKAIALPGAQNAFRRMHLNEWTEQAERWIDLAAWGRLQPGR
jgi:hypothetical protein